MALAGARQVAAPFDLVRQELIRGLHPGYPLL